VNSRGTEQHTDESSDDERHDEQHSARDAVGVAEEHTEEVEESDTERNGMLPGEEGRVRTGTTCAQECCSSTSR
jgi:hypothetical protein